MNVHSRNSSTSLGLSQRHFSMSWAVSPSPHRPLVRPGRLRNGQAFVVSGGLPRRSQDSTLLTLRRSTISVAFSTTGKDHARVVSQRGVSLGRKAKD